MDGILDLLQARPHMRTLARFDLREQRAYSEGYYTALVMALRVLDAAIEVHEHAERERRRRGNHKRSA